MKCWDFHLQLSHEGNGIQLDPEAGVYLASAFNFQSLIVAVYQTGNKLDILHGYCGRASLTSEALRCRAYGLN